MTTPISSPAAPTPTSTSRLLMGELLVKAGVITDAQLKSALNDQKQWGGKLGDLLIRKNYMTADTFVRALSKQLGLARADLSAEIPAEIQGLVPPRLLETYEVLPVALLDGGKTLAVATADPLNSPILDQIRSMTGLRVIPQVAAASSIRATIARVYRGGRQPAEPQILSNAEDAVPFDTRPPNTAPRSMYPPQRGEVTAPARLDMQFISENEPTPLQPDFSVGGPGPEAGPFQGSRSIAPRNAMSQPYFAPPSRPAPMSQPFFPAAERPPAGPLSRPYSPTQAPPFQAGPASVPSATIGADGSERALRTLVELLVEKGVISMDEYAAFLGR